MSSNWGPFAVSASSVLRTFVHHEIARQDEPAVYGLVPDPRSQIAIRLWPFPHVRDDLVSLRTRFCFVDFQWTAADVISIQSIDGRSSCLIFHFDESESPEPSGIPIGDPGYGINRSVLLEQLSNLGLS